MVSPRSIGDIADRGITLAVRRWRTLSVLVLLESVPIGVMRSALPEGRASLGASIIVDTLLVALLYPAAVLTATAPAAPAPGPMLRAAAGRYGASLVTIALSTAWTAVWLFLPLFVAILTALLFASSGNALGTGIAVAIAGGGTALALLPRAGLVGATMLPIVILERRSAWDALMLARQRVNHAGFLRSTLLGLAVFAVTVAPTLVVNGAIDTVVGITHLAALTGVAELISDAVSLGFGIVLSTVAALDLRARYEGAELEARLNLPVP